MDSLNQLKQHLSSLAPGEVSGQDWEALRPLLAKAWHRLSGSGGARIVEVSHLAYAASSAIPPLRAPVRSGGDGAGVMRARTALPAKLDPTLLAVKRSASSFGRQREIIVSAPMRRLWERRPSHRPHPAGLPCLGCVPMDSMRRTAGQAAHKAGNQAFSAGKPGRLERQSR